MIIYEGVLKIIHGSHLDHIWLGIAVMTVAGFVNLFVSKRILYPAARRTQSPQRCAAVAEQPARGLAPESRARQARAPRAPRELGIGARVLERGESPERGQQGEQTVAQRARRQRVEVVGHAGEGRARLRLESQLERRHAGPRAPRQIARDEAELGEPRGRQVAASAPQVGGPVEQDVGELQRLAHGRGEFEPPPLERRIVGGQARAEQPGEHHAHAARDHPAVVMQLGLGVEVGCPGRALRGPGGVAAHARTERAHAVGEGLAVRRGERPPDAQHARQARDQIEIALPAGDPVRLGGERLGGSLVVPERVEQEREARADLVRAPGPRVLEGVGGAAEQVAGAHRHAERSGKEADVEREGARDARQHGVAPGAVLGRSWGAHESAQPSTAAARGSTARSCRRPARRLSAGAGRSGPCRPSGNFRCGPALPITSGS